MLVTATRVRALVRRTAELLASLFHRIWQDGGLIVAVKPRPPFVRYFKTAERLNRQRTNRRGVE
jgi:hypothetical protein